VDPAANYLIIRINVVHKATDYPRGHKRETHVILIDLRTFKIVWRRVTTDPLIANSHWNFNKDGLLITRSGMGLSSHTKTSGSGKDRIETIEYLIENYEAAALSLPDLEPILPCRYKVVTGPYDASPRPRNVVQEGDTCANLLNAANVSSPEELPGFHPIPERIAKLAGPSCRFSVLTKAERLALYGCRTGYSTWWDTYKTTSRAETVFSVADGKTILSVPLPFNQEVLATLATLHGQEFLLLVRDGIKLETYQLP
jgi:hypothetical protein